MELLPQTIARTIPELYEQEELGDEAIIRVKFFDPCSQWTWYVLEYDGSGTFFGLVVGFETELGYFSLQELQEYKGPLGLGIERDLYFSPVTLRELKEHLKGQNRNYC